MININDRIRIIDKITEGINTGTVVFIEEDNEIPGLSFLYVVNDDPAYNTNYEPMLNMNIWRLIESTSDLYEKVLEEEE